MLMPFLLCVLILYFPQPDGGLYAPLPLGLAAVGLLALLNAAACLAGSGIALRLSAVPGERGHLAAHRVFSFLKGGAVGLVLADVLALRWPELVARLLGDARWGVIVYDLILVLPALVMLVTIMAAQYRFERKRGTVGLSLRSYLWLRFRVELGIILAPWLCLVLAGGITQAVLEDSESLALVGGIVSLAVLAAIIVFSPLVLRAIWTTSRLEDGPLRERLEAFCKRHRFRCNDILVWHTHRHLANAGVVGPTPLFRYVMLTDVLLQRCSEEEVEAIFAHEVGHILHRHLLFYLLFGATFVCLFASLVDLAALAGWSAPLADLWGQEMTVEQGAIMVVFAAIYWIPLFGFISRRMELQADLFAARSAWDPVTFATALGKLGAMSRAPGRLSHWRHFSIERRIEFVQDVTHNSGAADWFGFKIRLLRTIVVVLGGAGLIRLLLVRPELFGL